MLTKIKKLYGPLYAAGALIVVITVTVRGPMLIWLLGCVLLVSGVLLRLALARAQRPPKGEQREPVRLGAPVSGRWLALNGPAEKIPSHTHVKAQTYAVDMVVAAEGVADAHKERLATATWFRHSFRRPEEYASFGRPVIAPAAAVVVATSDSQRDHRCRLSLAGLILLMAEGLVRDNGPVRWLLGNHVILRIEDGVHENTYAVLAHLRRGTVQVAPGDRVSAGQQLAECGNSGNSSDPHVHYQLMDGPDLLTARGLPFAWDFTDDEGARHTGVPRNQSHFTPLPARTPDRAP